MAREHGEGQSQLFPLCSLCLAVAGKGKKRMPMALFHGPLQRFFRKWELQGKEGQDGKQAHAKDYGPCHMLSEPLSTTLPMYCDVLAGSVWHTTVQIMGKKQDENVIRRYMA